MLDLAAPIKEVTVYADRALVTRSGRLNLAAGEHEVRINDLPQFMRDSLRAAGRGPQGTRILTVDITTAFYSHPPEAELVTLSTELDQLQQRKQLFEARQSVLNDRRKWLRALGEQSRDFARGLAQGQMKPQDCADFFRFTAEQALQDAEAAQALEVQLKDVQLDIDAKERELARRQGQLQPDRLAALIVVALAEAGDLELEISYLVSEASWHPHYDVRVHMADDQNEGDVELTYNGVVLQSSGERWENIALSLSTARPSQAAILPELEPWYLNIYTARPVAPMYAQAGALPAQGRLRTMKAVSSNQAMHSPGAMLTEEETTGFSEPEAVVVAANVATASVEQSGTALIFRVGRSVDIPSDGSPHKTTIARDNLPCNFDYVSAPAIEENVHLRATISNTTERVLLGGEASIFLSGEYVGTTAVKTTAPTEKFKIFLGIDDGIKVKRELIERAVDKGMLLQGGIRRTVFTYHLLVHNYASAPRHVVIRDRLPVAQHERIKVRVLSIQPLPAERTKLELLTWKLNLAAGAEQQIEYRFGVEQPQDVTVTGLA